MRKILAVIISAFLIVTLVACNSEVKQENETTNSIAETTVLNTEIKTEKSADASQGELIKIKNEEHTFTFRKVNFEKEYSEEFLMEILTLIPMEFGCDDYDNWGGTPNEILNDAFSDLRSGKSKVLNMAVSSGIKLLMSLVIPPMKDIGENIRFAKLKI